MLKKFVATLVFISISLAGLVSIATPANAEGDADATLNAFEVHADVSPQNNAFYGSVAMDYLQDGQFYYNVYSSRQNLRVYARANDSSATIKVTGGNLNNYTMLNSTDQYWTDYKVAPIVVQEAMNQIVNVVVTAGDGVTTKTYKLNIATGSMMPTPQVINSSLTTVSTAGGTKGVMYLKNFNRCSKIEMKYPYVDRNGDAQVASEEISWDYITTDNNGITKLSVYSYGNTYTFRNSKVVADLVVSSDAQAKGNWRDGYWGCLEHGYDTSAYADTVVPKAISFKNPTITAVDVPGTVSQMTAFKVTGANINADSNLNAYLLNPATGNKLWLDTYDINNDSYMLTVSGYSTADEWKTNQTLDLYIDQYDSYGGNDDNWVYSEDVNLFTKKAIKFTPKMASQVAVSPAKGPIAGGNKVTITGHGIYNGSTNRWATITIGGNPVLDFRQVDRDYFSSSDNKKWDGVGKATFIVPAGVAGPADIVVDMGYGPTTLSQKYMYGDKPTVSSISPSSVAVTGNSMITLTGTNFGISGTPVVIIDGVKSSYVVRVSPTKVLAMVPPKSSAGDVSVDIISSSGGGALDTLATLKYVARGTNPTVSKITPATDGLSGGNEIVITGTGFNATATGVTIGGVAAKVTSATATTLKIESPAGESVGNKDVVVATPTGLVTKAAGFKYIADPGISSVSPNSIASTAVVADTKVTISGSAFGTSGTITVGSAKAIKYTATGGGTTISNIVIPTTKAGTVNISVLPTGAKKAFTSSVTVTGPKVTYVGPEDIKSTRNIFGDVNPWTNDVDGIPAAPANNGSETFVVEGSGFGSAGTLKIGTVTVPTTSYTSTKVTFIAPSDFAAGKYTLTVVPSVGTLTGVSPSEVVIGPQLSVPSITKVEVNTPITDPNRESDPNVFWPTVLTDSDLYTITGTGFNGSDNGASTKLRAQSVYSYKNNYDEWVNLTIVSKTDTSIVFKADRTLQVWDWYSLQVVTKDSQVVIGEGLYYDMIDDTYNNSPAYLDNYYGLCNKDAIGSYTPAIFRVIDSENTLTARGVVKLNGTVVPAGAVTWTPGGVTINLDNQTAVTDLWGQKKLELLPSDNQDPISWMVTCGVSTSVTTKLNGSTAPLAINAGVSFTPSAEIVNALPGTTWTEPADNYEFQTQETKNVGGGWTKGLPVRHGVYYVRARITGSVYDTTKYYELNAADVKVTITGTPITFTPKLIAGGSSLTYKGQLGDGTNGTTADIGYTVTPTPADTITSVTYQYRNKACATGWASGLPKNVPVTPQNCGGDGTATSVWEIRVASYTMNVGGVDKTILYVPTFAVFELSINKKDVTLSTVKAEKIYDGTTAVTLQDVVITGGIKDETLVLDPTFARGATFPEATAGKDKTVTLGGAFKLAGLFNTNYRITNPNMVVKGEIKKANTELKIVPSVTALVLGKVPSVSLTATALDTKTKRAPIQAAGVAEAVLVSKTAGICTLSGTTVTPVSAGKCVIAMTQASSANYNAGVSYANSPETTETVTINIYGAPKDLSIVADDIKIATGTALNPTAAATGLLGEDTFEGIEFDYYQGSTKLDSAPTAIGTYKVVPKGGTLTAASEDAYTGVKKYIAGKLVITPAAPVITSISPSHGPEAGGDTVTIKGTGLAAVTSVTLGANTLRKPAFSVNAAGTAITFVVPKGVGGLDIALNAGTAEATTLYTYDAPFRAPEEVTGPETPTDPADLTLDLVLKLKVGTKLSGQKVGIAGGGLKAFSEYKLEMFSDPILVYTGTTDKDGNFNENVTLPPTVCIEAGKHTLKLSGLTPEGKATSDSDSFSLLEKCEVGATAIKTGDKQWTLDGFLFAFNSPVLSDGGKKSLNDLVGFMKGAKTITILGYTETDTKSELVKALNLILSKQRTESVMAYLKTKGVSAKFVTIGKGGVDPVSIKDQAKNRRVVIKAQY